MNLNHWCDLDEQIYISETDEEYKQYAGLVYNEKLIENLAELKIRSSQIFIDFFSKPRELLLGSIEDIAYSKTKSLELELHNTRNTKIVSSRNMFKGSPVNWSTWRQFNSKEEDHEKRKDVYDEFIAKTHYITPIVVKRFSLIKEVYRDLGERYGLDPISSYLEQEKISYSRLVEFIKSMGQRAKRPFQEALMEVSRSILGRQPEYYDDFYFFRNKVYSDIDKNFSRINPVNEVKKTLTYMDFDPSKIHFDTEDRKDKYPSPICFFVRIPTDIRVLYKRETPIFDFQACFHETGHAIHASSVDPNIEYWNKYRISMGIAEIFSTFLERLTKSRQYIQSLIGSTKIDEIVINKFLANTHLMELFFVTFYTANSLMKMEYWRQNLSADQACEVYSRLIKEYTGFEVPGEYWLLHHILPESIMYVPSYLLAAVRAAELESCLRDRFGDMWWKEKDSGKRLREIMKPGASIDLSTFSRLDSSKFLNEITEQA
ncbi:MAG: M3 family metallopeptidase [Nitrososphaeraceae archaeon]